MRKGNKSSSPIRNPEGRKRRPGREPPPDQLLLQPRPGHERWPPKAPPRSLQIKRNGNFSFDPPCAAATGLVSGPDPSAQHLRLQPPCFEPAFIFLNQSSVIKLRFRAPSRSTIRSPKTSRPRTNPKLAEKAIPCLRETQGLKPGVDRKAFAARVNSCPDTKLSRRRFGPSAPSFASPQLRLRIMPLASTIHFI